MRKSILILLISFFSFQGFAQEPDPELFRTWYARFVLSTDLNDPYEVSEISSLSFRPEEEILTPFSLTLLFNEISRFTRND